MSEASPSSTHDDPLWREQLAPYARPRPLLTALDILTGPVAYLALWPLMVWSLGVSYWLTLLISIPAAGFLLRTFILFHDCTHGSLFARRETNLWFGRAFGLLVFHPFAHWRHSHAVHHGSAGDLDRRGAGDVMTMTVAEYRQAPLRARLSYRAFRNPAVMFGLGPVWALVVQPRIPPSTANRALRNSVWLTNLAVIVLVAGVCLLIGWQEYLLVQTPMVLIAGSMGVWLFFVQHQFEDVYWESSEDWSYADAALRGSSHLKLPKPLQFFTGNIGLHHVHHLSTRVPNYSLQAANDGLSVFADVPVLTFWQSLRCTRFKLIDERTGRLLTWRQARQLDHAPGGLATDPAA